jgi:hypothetical protein
MFIAEQSFLKSPSGGFRGLAVYRKNGTVLFERFDTPPFGGFRGLAAYRKNGTVFFEKLYTPGTGGGS